MPFDPSFADDDYCYLTTTGRTSGEPREIEIWFALDGDRLYMMAGGGYSAHWVRNLRKTPEVRVRIRDVELDGHASVVEEPEQERTARRLLVDKYSPRSSNDLTSWGRTALPVVVELG